MKLSMFILVDWLNKYKLSININDGQPILSGARLYSGEQSHLDDSMLYVGSAFDFSPDQFQGGQVICTNRQDWILIESSDITTVLNDVLKAFEFYNEWETNLKEAAYSNISFQTLIDLSYPVFKNPIFMVDWYGKVLGLTSQSEAKMDGVTWDYMCIHGYLPVYIYDVVKISNEQFQVIENNKEIIFFDVPEYDYHCIHCTIFIENRPFLNFEISKNETELTEGMRQLAEILKQAVIIMLRFSNPSAFMPPSLALFSGILAGESYSPEALHQVLFTLGWEHTKSWYLVTFLNPFPGEMPGTALLQQLELGLSCGFYFEWENHLIMLIDCEDWDANLPILTKLLKDGSYSAGVSMPFNDIKDLPSGLKQAEVALSYSNQESVISLCTNFAWDYMLGEFAQNFKNEGMLHPAIETLEKYDQKNGSELLKTLYVYLQNERSAVDTANKLFIHRNSLRYRLERISELINVDLDNPDIRMHLLLSHQMKDRKQKTK